MSSGCSFGHKYFAQTGGSLDGPDNYVIQLDDYGQFWNQEEADLVLKTISETAEKENVAVVLFIHGWHHNANVNDSNAKDFARSLTRLRKKVDDQVNGVPGGYRLSRRFLTGIDDMKVIGVYVGWRGRSLPSFLDYTTFWGRQAAAKRVGQGDLRPFLSRLNSIYKRRQKAGSRGANVPFMSLSSFGHSFGGQVLFSAVEAILEDELLEKESGTKASKVVGLEGFGTLVVLLNPALEAIQYESIHSLNKEMSYGSTQTPLMLIVSADSDIARRKFFPIGRNLGTINRASFREGQRELWTKALGEYEGHRTHEVKIVDHGEEDLTWFSDLLNSRDFCKIVDFDLTNIPVIGGVSLIPDHDSQKYNPYLVAYSTGDLVIKHNGVFDTPLHNFLSDYIAVADGKRLLLNHKEKTAHCYEN